MHAIFSARNPFFCDKKCRIIMCCDKTELYLTVLQQNNVLSGSLSGSLWLPMAPSGSLWLSLALRIGLQSPCLVHKALAWLTRPLLSSERRSCAPALYSGLDNPMETWQEAFAKKKRFQMHYHIKELTDSITGSALLWLREVSIKITGLFGIFSQMAHLSFMKLFHCILSWNIFCCNLSRNIFEKL